MEALDTTKVDILCLKIHLKQILLLWSKVEFKPVSGKIAAVMKHSFFFMENQQTTNMVYKEVHVHFLFHFLSSDWWIYFES